MKRLLICLAVFALAACGGKGGGSGTGDGGNGDGDGGGGGDGGGDGDGGVFIDAPPFGGMCTPDGPQCSNCVDDDGDGDIDGADVECSGPFDNDESSFATGIPGDNKDAVNQDCFFDGNSGAGNDGCNIHVCCILGATTVADCPIGQNQYDPMQCPPPLGTQPLSQQCIDTCGQLAPPGCDCFGCCTLCDPVTNMCFDIATNPATSPNCDSTNISDPAACIRCEKNQLCGNSECGGTTCILCPGQDMSDLPAECMGNSVCPDGLMECGAGGVCPDQFFCSGQDPGCCVNVLQ
jgi:hypothetical protein